MKLAFLVLAFAVVNFVMLAGTLSKDAPSAVAAAISAFAGGWCLGIAFAMLLTVWARRP